jgi:CTP:molybdopterin cytidylyltransferase MocA
LLTRAAPPDTVAAMPAIARVDVLLSTLNATDVGTLDSIRAKLEQVKQELMELDQPELAARAAETIASLARGDVAEFKRGRAFLQSKIGHLR